jgi:hypothetical protein
MPANKRRNPFYVLLIPVGAAFVVTAFAYGIMAFQAVNVPSAHAREIASDSAHPLFQWLRTHGDAAMLWELTVLAVLTLAAIATDRVWDAPRFNRQETH